MTFRCNNPSEATVTVVVLYINALFRVHWQWDYFSIIDCHGKWYHAYVAIDLHLKIIDGLFNVNQLSILMAL